MTMGAAYSIESSMPEVRGRLIEGAPLAKLTWFRTGGRVDYLFRPADLADLKEFLADLSKEIPVTLIGLGSNLLVRDGGLRGVAIKLGKPFGTITIDGNRLIAGGGAGCVTLAQRALAANLSGLEFFRGIPGSIGGAVAMNAGAYGAEAGDVLHSVKYLDRSGQEFEVSASEIDWGYRKSSFGPELIIVQAIIEGTPDRPDRIQEKMDEIIAEREESQPLRTRTGGSTFKNPDPELSSGRKAWQLIEEAGCRGMSVGGARVSEKHCNFLINTGTATSQDIETLGEQVRGRVKAATGIDLEWEIRRVGEEKP